MAITAITVLMLSAGANAQKGDDRFSVYVFTVEHDQDGFLDAATRDRIDTVGDLKSAFRGRFGLRKKLPLVKEPERADMRIEVTNRATLEGSNRVGIAVPLGGVVVGESRPGRIREIEVIMTVGTYQRNFQIKEPGTWSEVAVQLVKEIERFTDDNRSKLSELASHKS